MTVREIQFKSVEQRVSFIVRIREKKTVFDSKISMFGVEIFLLIPLFNSFYLRAQFVDA